jgi:hypothetical protein
MWLLLVMLTGLSLTGVRLAVVVPAQGVRTLGSARQVFRDIDRVEDK